MDMKTKKKMIWNEEKGEVKKKKVNLMIDRDDDILIHTNKLQLC